MKRLTGFLLAGLLLLTAAPAWAQQAYLSGNIGFGIRPDADITAPGGPFFPFENDPAFVINGAIGVELNPMIRIEGEIGLHSNTADIQDFLMILLSALSVLWVMRISIFPPILL